MFNRIRCVRRIAATASISVLAGCGLMPSHNAGDGHRIVVGTTSAPSTLDPAAAWDGSWELFRNIYQTLLAYPVGATEPKPDAAENCTFSDAAKRTYRCTLRGDMTFSNGDTLDAHAVKYSVDRIRRINVPGGPVGLLGSLDRVETRGDSVVVFHLKKADATFPFVLATPAMSIVDPADYPADAVRKDGGITASGPYELKKYVAGDRAELTRNDSYKGFADLKNDSATIRYFQDSHAMVDALEKKQIDVTVRGLAADDIVALQGGRSHDGLQLIEEAGAETSYLVFNPEDGWARKLPVRRAVAQLIDRGAIADKIYKGTVDPLYSMIPKGVVGHTAGFFDDYGDPSVSRARGLLTDAGITEPVPLTMWFASDRYGSATAPMFAEIKRQLEASGLFRITLRSRPWTTFEAGYQKGEYPVFGRGWSPDFPDPDDFVTPFVGEQNALGTPYRIPKITDELLPRSREESDRGEVVKQFQQTQDILVADARLIPLWQSKLFVAANDDVSGAESAFDSSSIMMVWELGRKTSW
ncbi:solute-binding transport lipoprotein [Streptomyces sulfonofaciens]|uniref:Solute-binding transport lipoprotein n=1 Tax=Streptomyces sulfonofaciens TaxID=68272 RepID=A0A919GJ72_9ACTN|nr:ABC transporter substrate-binding protein [Streptomyces sulfonofaciens]GHH84975.1 solute-binding transport lipoprotein [Streptomyces sulfonofaciens]